MSIPSPYSRRINRLVLFQHRSALRFLISTRWLLIHHLPVLLPLYCITQNKGLVIQKLLSAFDFHRFLQFPAWKIFSFTKKRLLRKKFRTKRTFCKKSFLSFSRTGNVQSNISSMSVLKVDEISPGFPLEENSRPFVQVYLISLLLQKKNSELLPGGCRCQIAIGIVFHFLFFSNRRSCFRWAAFEDFHCKTGTVVKNG